MQGYARCGEGTSNPRKAGQARCVDPSGVCIAKCVTCQRIRRTLAGTGILGSSLGGGICEPCGEGRHFVTASVRSNLTETPGPRFGRVLAKKNPHGLSARLSHVLVFCPAQVDWDGWVCVCASLLGGRLGYIGCVGCVGYVGFLRGICILFPHGVGGTAATTAWKCIIIIIIIISRTCRCFCTH